MRFDLPHPALPDADWADCFEITVPRAITAGDAARRAFSRMPAWAGALMAVRDALMRPFGLKGADEATRHSGKTVGFFPVLEESESELVAGFDDRHLDFRLFVHAVPVGAAGTRVRVATLVRRNNRLGRIYLAVISPFHKLIVAAVTSRIS
ncbi:uncharacterized protein DUF2867 [Hoeflea marina]|uniref:Uncharacterized protein DUF2867 n=1 Tax=Hoeflea marina TaxID=274592 RepID=A0A317PJB2_9HYPH|nr:uncharacterized protein DUF2867 [Hoeflea marina]